MTNGTMLQGFSWYLPADGSHWRRIAEQAPSFAYEGITAVWMPPAYKGQAGAQDVGYGVYDTYDLGEFDQKGSVATKYGTRAEYRAAIGALHANGIQALADVVLNQRLGADGCEDVLAQEVLGSDRDERVGVPQTISAWTRFTFPGRAGAYSDFTWDWTCFHGVDWDDRARRKAIFLFDGKHWDDAVERAENGNYDYLMGADVDVNDPRVYEELVRWGRWYVDECSLDGFRLDALKHICGEKGLYQGRFTSGEVAGERWGCVIGEQDDALVGDDGWVTFRTLGGRLSVYLPERSADALEHDRQLHRIAREIAEDTEEMRV